MSGAKGERTGPQLPLPVQLTDEDVFENFHLPEGSPNRVARAAAQALARPEARGTLFLAGPTGSGKSHLLKALCRESQAHRPIRYLCLANHARWAPELLDDWVPAGAVVAFDAIDCIAGQRDWERAILAVFHELQDTGGVFAAAADAAPTGSAWALADLGSRLGWGGVFALAPLDDESKLRALQMRAARRGLTLSEPVARYLMAREARHPAHLFAVLDTLDRAALAAQRRLTIPLLRALLDDADRTH
ncbi:MAG: DnaA regulatory inactivator Hda [Pseudomonadota bacterium]